MKKIRDKKIAILQKIALSAVLIFLAATSCINRRDKTEQKNLIPEKTFVSILSDVYIANGLLTLPEIRKTFSKRDSVLNYIDIIESYGYSYEAMNSTMNFYFVSKPKKLIRIYDQVIRRMSERETAIQNEIMRIGQAAARASMKDSVYLLPDPDLTENPGFSRIINPPGTYTLIISVTIYPDDPSFNPSLTTWYCSADSSETGKKWNLPPIKYVKDGHPHLYTFTGRIEVKKPVVLKTIFYDYENNFTEWDKHARIEVISFNFTGDEV
jgi:hypothetical protein